MRIQYYHASEYGNGAKVAEEFKRIMATKGIDVEIQHVKDAEPKTIPSADLYLISSPGRFGKPIGSMRHFLKKANFAPAARYAVLATEMNPVANTQQTTTPQGELGPCQQIIPRITEMLDGKGLRKVAEGKIFVTGLHGPLEQAWQSKVDGFVQLILGLPQN